MHNDRHLIINFTLVASMYMKNVIQEKSGKVKRVRNNRIKKDAEKEFRIAMNKQKLVK